MKIHQFILIVGFIGMIGGGLGLHLVVPDRPVSSIENRTLASAPTDPQIDEILSGQWSSNVSTYFSDQFPGRDRWLETFVKAQMAYGKTYINEKYYADQETGWITTGPSPLVSENELDYGVARTEEVAEAFQESNTPFLFISLPAKATYVRTPHPSFVEEDTGLINNERFLSKLQDQNIDTLKLMDSMLQFNNGKMNEHNWYFKTDHHWNMEGAYLGYQALMDELSNHFDQPITQKEVQRSCLTNPFLGSWNNFFYKLIENDDQICHIEPENFGEGMSIQVNTHAEQETAAFNDIYAPAKSFDNTRAVNYASGFTGDYAELTIETENFDIDQHLIVLKDSYFNAMTFHIAQHFSKTTVIDVRHFQGDLYRYLTTLDGDYAIAAYNDRNFGLGFDER